MYNQWIEVNSSNLKSVFYSTYDSKLSVKFHSGSEYKYDRVPIQLYENLLNASSKGSYFHSIIKDKFDCQRMI